MAGCEADGVVVDVRWGRSNAPPTSPTRDPRASSMATSARPRGRQNGRPPGAAGTAGGGGTTSGSVALDGAHHSGGGGPLPGTPALGAGQGALSRCMDPGSAAPRALGSSGKEWAVQLWPSQYLRWPLYQGSG